MAGVDLSLVGYGTLTAVTSAAVCWLNLARRYADKGRLTGSRHTVWLTLTIIGATVLVAVITTTVLSRTQGVAAAAAGVFASMGVFPRSRNSNTDNSRALAKVMSLGIAYLTDRLVDRMRLDEASWCEQMLSGFKDFGQMQTFVHELTVDYLQPRLDPKVYEDAETRLETARRALAEAAGVQERIDKECRLGGPLGHPRQRTMAERQEYDKVAGEARKASKLVLALTYERGRRSEDPVLQRIRQNAAPDAAFADGDLPAQRRGRSTMPRR